MKKLVMSILTILTCGAAYALPVGNPSEASLFTNGLWCGGSTGCCDFCDPCFSWCDAWSFRVGYYGDFVFDRHLERGDDDDDDDDLGGDLQDAEIFTNAAYLVVNFCNRLDVFATLGQSDFQTRQNTSLFVGTPFAGFESELWFSPAFSWSIGARATLWQCDCFALGIEGQYFSARPDLDHAVVWGPAFFGEKFYFDDFDTHYREWQVGLGVSYRIATSCPTIAFIPYAAVKYARARWSVTGEETLIGPLGTAGTARFDFPGFHAHKHWGWALGLTFTLCDAAGVTVEGRWADEKALYVNGQFRF